jgi:hypothetical protein
MAVGGQTHQTAVAVDMQTRIEIGEAAQAVEGQLAHIDGFEIDLGDPAVAHGKDVFTDCRALCRQRCRFHGAAGDQQQPEKSPGNASAWCQLPN